MNFVLTPEDYCTVDWSGGKTSELFIYPATANLYAKNFNIRLSTATLEIDETTFTPLPEIDRALMVLEGEIELSHKGQHTAKLEKYDVDRFKGGWKTTSKGKGVGFNLMTSEGYEGAFSVVDLGDREHKIFALDEDDFNFIYAVEGSLTVQTEKGDFGLDKESLLVLEGVRKIRCSSMNSAEFIMVTVKSPKEE